MNTVFVGAYSLMAARILLIVYGFCEVAGWNAEQFGGDAERRNRISPVRRSVAI